jgi:predicted DNA-binding transcriptional regulator YafY
MSDLVKMIQSRQGDMSIEEYANKMGFRGATLFRYYNNERAVGLNVVRKMAEYYRRQNDIEMLRALGSYALGFEVPVPSPN